MAPRKGTPVTTTVGLDLLKFLDGYCEMRAIPRGQGMRELMEVAQRMSVTYAMTTKLVAHRGYQKR